MCSLLFVWNVKDAAVSTVCQQSMCSPWTHCLTPNSPDFTPSDFFVPWGTFCAFSTHGTHNLHANTIAHFTHITSETMTDRFEELVSGWGIISDVSVMGLTLRENCPVCVGCMCQILNNRMEDIMFYKVSFFFHCPNRYIRIFVFKRHLDRIRYIVVSYDSIFLGFILFRRSACKIISVFKYSTRLL